MYYNTKALFGRALELSTTSGAGWSPAKVSSKPCMEQPIPGAAATQVESHSGKT